MPGDSPELFAPGIVSCGLFTRDIAWTRPGNGNATVYWMSAAFLDRLRPDGF